MSYLYIEKEIVKITDEGFVREEVKRVFSNDRRGNDKAYFQDIITAIYFIYTPRTLYWNKSLNERIDIVNKDHLEGRKWENILKRDGVPEMVKGYIDLCQTINDKMQDKLNSDANEMIELLVNTPMTIKQKISAGAVLKDKEGIDREFDLEYNLSIPNIDQKKQYYDLALTIANTIKKINEALKIEADERMKEELAKRLYDSREANKDKL